MNKLIPSKPSTSFKQITKLTPFFTQLIIYSTQFWIQIIFSLILATN